jgi:hypothetical protein
MITVILPYKEEEQNKETEKDFTKRGKIWQEIEKERL